MRLAGFLATALCGGLGTGLAMSAWAAPSTSPSAVSPPAAAVAPSWKAAYAGAHSQRGEAYYARLFGIGELQVRSTASGSSLEFRYRVLDAQKAVLLNDKRLQPLMIDQKTGNRLSVTTVEQIGALRQTALPEPGREYWMVFGNPGKLVKRGERVDVVIGPFRATSLMVQ